VLVLVSVAAARLPVKFRNPPTCFTAKRKCWAASRRCCQSLDGGIWRQRLRSGWLLLPQLLMVRLVSSCCCCNPDSAGCRSRFVKRRWRRWFIDYERRPWVPEGRWLPHRRLHLWLLLYLCCYTCSLYTGAVAGAQRQLPLLRKLKAGELRKTQTFKTSCPYQFAAVPVLLLPFNASGQHQWMPQSEVFQVDAGSWPRMTVARR
jgi:hypothetical protein